MKYMQQMFCKRNEYENEEITWVMNVVHKHIKQRSHQGGCQERRVVIFRLRHPDLYHHRILSCGLVVNMIAHIVDVQYPTLNAPMEMAGRKISLVISPAYK